MKTGILNRATEAKATNEQKTAEEELRLGISALTIDYRKNTTNATSFRNYVMDNRQALANAMGINANELEMDSTSYSVTYKGQVYIVGENGGLEPFRLIELTGFNIKESEVTVQQGKTKQLTIENKTPSEANEQIVWESSNETIATVNANGVVKGILAGNTATITATSASGVTSSTSCVVTVTEATSEIPEGRTDRVEYGKYVNYSITKNDVVVELGIGEAGPVDDWRVFYDDGENVYIIASDYVPVATLASLNSNYIKEGTTKKTIKEALNIVDNTTYNVYWSNTSSLPKVGAADIFGTNAAVGTKKLIEKGFLGFWKANTTTNINPSAKMVASLIDTDTWKGFAEGTIPSEVIDTPYAIGGPTLSMWIESWNILYSNDKLFYNRANSIGYNVKFESQPSSSEYWIDLNSKNGYSNTLYVPRVSSTSDACYGYWLVSPSAKDVYIGEPTNEMAVTYGGGVNYYEINYNHCAVRPVVCLPSGIGLKTGSNGNYDITNNLWD